MVARIESGKSIRGVLVYNEKKVDAGTARLLLESGFPLEATLLSFKNKVDYFKKFTRKNTRAKTNTLHITLNFSPKDTLDDEMLKRIAEKYMEGIGFGGQPFLVYQHFDAAHPHLHIATVNIRNDGSRIETHNLGRTKSEVIRKEIEVSFGLIRAEDQKREQSFQIEPIQLERVVYGKTETKKAITNVVREVLKTYKFCSLPELNAVLNQFGVYAFGGAPGSSMFENGGLIYGLLDENNQKVGVPIKASAIYGGPTLKRLNKLFAGNKVSRKPFGQRLKLLLDDAVKNSGSRDELESRLRKHGVRVIFRKNIQGNLMGVTLIDNATRVVFNGSALGKKYAAKALFEALMHGTGALSPSEHEPRRSDDKEPAGGQINDAGVDNSDRIPCLNLPVIETIITTLVYDEHESSEFVPHKRKRRKVQLTQ